MVTRGRSERRLGGRAGMALASGAACLLASLGIVAASDGPARAGINDRLEPDMVTLPIGSEQLDLTAGRGRRLRLELDNTVANRGDGPLEIVSGRLGAGRCADDEYSAVQRVYQDDDGNGFTGNDAASGGPSFGCIRYHPKQGHEHWHVVDFTIYRLFSERSGRRVALERKQGFCLWDHSSAFSGLPRYSPSPEYGTDGCQFGDPELGENESIREGLSIGWSDLYQRDLPGQSLDVTGIKRGRYCLTATADPLNLLSETDDANNTRRTKVLIRPYRGTVRRLPGGCRAKPPEPSVRRGSLEAELQ